MQPDGRVLVLGQDGMGEELMAADEFERRFVLATVEDLRAAAGHGQLNGSAAAPVPQLVPASSEPIRRGRRRGPRARQTSSAPAARPSRVAARELNEEKAWQRIRDMWDAKTPVMKILKIIPRAGASVLTASKIYSYANYHHWPARKGAGSFGTAAKVTVTPTRRCSACQQMTTQDPCHLCKAPWKREYDA